MIILKAYNHPSPFIDIKKTKYKLIIIIASAGGLSLSLASSAFKVNFVSDSVTLRNDHNIITKTCKHPRPFIDIHKIVYELLMIIASVGGLYH
jgi:hypothetical protein